jgi:steroid 5-alpha reductase family enzyme
LATPLLTTMAATLATTLAAFVVLWMVGTARREASIVDAYWGLGFVVVVWQAITMNDAARWRPLLLASFVTVWGVRLAWHIFRRNHGRGEDRRYAAMRSKHGDRFWWISLFTVFLLQAVILWFLSWPLLVSASALHGYGFSWLDAVGIIGWVVGFAFEAVGDWQLARFRANPRHLDKVMDEGLWRYTRHPNYFGECLTWWGVYLIACGDGAWWTALSPAVLTLLLLRVSGVSLLEADIAGRRPDYVRYRRAVNAFIPGPRRPT